MPLCPLVGAVESEQVQVTLAQEPGQVEGRNADRGRLYHDRLDSWVAPMLKARGVSVPHRHAAVFQCVEYLGLYLRRQKVPCVLVAGLDGVQHPNGVHHHMKVGREPFAD